MTKKTLKELTWTTDITIAFDMNEWLALTGVGVGHFFISAIIWNCDIRLFLIHSPSYIVGADIQIFNNPDFGKIRIMEIDGELWLVGKDVAAALGYGDTAQAIRKHIDKEDKGVVETTTPGGKQMVTIINESGLYSLSMSSKLPDAKKFKRWVTSEVLPSIRKTGSYAVANEQTGDVRRDYIAALRAYADEIEKSAELEVQDFI